MQRNCALRLGRYRAAAHSRQWRRCLSCSQSAEPPQARQYSRRLPWAQKDEPPQGRHRDRCQPCSQMDTPPQSRHVLRWEPTGEHTPEEVRSIAATLKP